MTTRTCVKCLRVRLADQVKRASTTATLYLCTDYVDCSQATKRRLDELARTTEAGKVTK